MLPQLEIVVRKLNDKALCMERDRIAALPPKLGEYEKAIANEYSRRGFFKVFTEKTEFAANSLEEFAEQFRGMGLPVTEYDTFANMYCASWSVKFGEYTWLQVSDGVGKISHYTGVGSCSWWPGNLTSYIDVAEAVCEFLLDAAPMPAYMARIAEVTGIENRDDLRLIEDAMRAENNGLLDGLSRHEFDTAARRIVREL